MDNFCGVVDLHTEFSVVVCAWFRQLKRILRGRTRGACANEVRYLRGRVGLRIGKTETGSVQFGFARFIPLIRVSIPGRSALRANRLRKRSAPARKAIVSRALTLEAAE